MQAKLRLTLLSIMIACATVSSSATGVRVSHASSPALGGAMRGRATGRSSQNFRAGSGGISPTITTRRRGAQWNGAIRTKSPERVQRYRTGPRARVSHSRHKKSEFRPHGAGARHAAVSTSRSSALRAHSRR
jgi:hypothetical protein